MLSHTYASNRSLLTVQACASSAIAAATWEASQKASSAALCLSEGHTSPLRIKSSTVEAYERSDRIQTFNADFIRESRASSKKMMRYWS
jgi:hypothetical protein